MSDPATGKKSSAARHTGAKHRGRVLSLMLAGGAYETVSIAQALGLLRETVLPVLRALEREGLIVEAFRTKSRTGTGNRSIVWKLATP